MDAGVTRLLALRVSEVMSKEVITVEKNQPLSRVAQTLIQRRISAAPVVDEEGICLGIISSTDFMRCALDPDSVKQPGRSASEFQWPHQGDDADSPHEIAPGSEDTAGEHMVSGVQAAYAGASLVSAARMMCAAHLHHLPVINEKGRPVGFLSTLDVVSAMVHAIDEAKNDLGLAE